MLRLHRLISLAVRNGQVELALGLTLVVDEQVEQVTIRNEQLILALASDHPAFHGADQSIQLAHIRPETLILYEDRAPAGSLDPVLRFIEHVGFKRAETMSIRGLSAARGLVAAGIGISRSADWWKLMRSRQPGPPWMKRRITSFQPMWLHWVE